MCSPPASAARRSSLLTEVCSQSGCSRSPPAARLGSILCSKVDERRHEYRSGEGVLRQGPQSSGDLNTSACCDVSDLPAHLKPQLANLHDQALEILWLRAGGATPSLRS